MIEFAKHSQHIAKKEHKCDLCGNVINVGEKYEHGSGKYDGEFYDSKHHLNCVELIRRYCRYHDDDMYTEDAVFDWVYDRVCSDCTHGNEDNDEYTPCPYKSPCECSKVYELTKEKNMQNLNERGAAYIPIAKARGITPHSDKTRSRSSGTAR